MRRGDTDQELPTEGEVEDGHDIEYEVGVLQSPD